MILQVPRDSIILRFLKKKERKRWNDGMSNCNNPISDFEGMLLHASWCGLCPAVESHCNITCVEFGQKGGRCLKNQLTKKIVKCGQKGIGDFCLAVVNTCGNCFHFFEVIVRKGQTLHKGPR